MVLWKPIGGRKDAEMGTGMAVCLPQTDTVGDYLGGVPLSGAFAGNELQNEHTFEVWSPLIEPLGKTKTTLYRACSTAIPPFLACPALFPYARIGEGAASNNAPFSCLSAFAFSEYGEAHAEASRLDRWWQEPPTSLQRPSRPLPAWAPRAHRESAVQPACESLHVAAGTCTRSLYTTSFSET